MRTVTPLDLRRSLGQLLDEASAGERLLIERDHKPLAVLVSVEDAARLEEDPGEAQRRRDAAFAALEEWRQRVLATRDPDASRPTAAEEVRADRDERDRRDQRRARGIWTDSSKLE
jgi:prevent-host-death family protein